MPPGQRIILGRWPEDQLSQRLRNDHPLILLFCRMICILDDQNFSYNLSLISPCSRPSLVNVEERLPDICKDARVPHAIHMSFIFEYSRRYYREPTRAWLESVIFVLPVFSKVLWD